MGTLDDKKVYVGKLVMEVIEKALSLGYKGDIKHLKKYPFLIFNSSFKSIIGYFYIDSFNDHPFEEVTPEWILSLPEPVKDIRKERGVRGFYIDNQGKVSKKNYLYNSDEMKHFRFFSSESVAEAWARLPELLYWRDKYNEGWVADWENENRKYIISFEENIVIKGYVCGYSRVLAFKTEEIRDKFLNDFRNLIKICKPLL